LALGAAGVSFADLFRGWAQQAPSAKPGFQLGCFTRPFDQHDYRTALDAIAEAGFRFCGLMTAKAKSWVVIHEDTTPDEAAQIRQEASQRGLRVLCVYADWKTLEPAAAAVAALRRLIEHCAACGSPSLMLGGTGDERLFKPYYQAIAECCPYAATHGIGLTIKPHGGLNATGPQCRRIIESVGHASFRLWYDPGNILYYSDGQLDPVEDAATVNGLVVGMSIKDFLPPKEVMVAPGQGKVDFPRVLARLKQGGFTSGPLLIETLAPGDLRQVTDQARAARQFLAKLTA
jgi:sugar phosphate isomerase/epimerase